MYPEHQALLQQKTDTDFEAVTLTLQRLKTVLVKLNKKSYKKLKAFLFIKIALVSAHVLF